LLRNRRLAGRAKRVGLKAVKSRWRRDSVDNLGEFMLIDPISRFAIAGFRFDLSPEEVVEFCKE